MEPNNQTMIEINTMKMVFCKFIFTLLAITFFATNAEAEDEPYFTVAQDENNSNYYTITFKYDNQRSYNVESVGDHQLENFASVIQYNLQRKITTITFDESCKNCPIDLDFANAFQNLVDLTTLNLEYIYPKITNMAYMFESCTKLTEIDLSSAVLSNVNNFDNMFTNCSSLKSIKFNPNSITKPNANYSHMFSYCGAIKTLDLRSFVVAPSSYEYIVGMFDGCPSLTTIYTSSQFNLSSLTPPVTLFDGCNNLEGGNGTKYNGEVTSKYACPDLPGQPGYFTLLDEQYAVLSKDGTLTFYYDNKQHSHTETEDIVIFVNSPFKSEYSYFLMTNTEDYRKDVTSVVFDKSFAAARPTDLSSWFRDCNFLTSIKDIVYLNTSEVTTMERLFCNCFKLTELNLAYFNTAKVSNMKSMFDGCEKLTKIYVGPSWDVSNVNNSEYMFSGCNLLEGEYTKFIDFFSTSDDPILYNKTYAHYDDGGLLTTGKVTYMACVNKQDVVLRNYEEENPSLLFRCDDQWNNLSIYKDKIFLIEIDANTPTWNDLNVYMHNEYHDKTKFKTIIFDDSFSDPDNKILSYANWFNGFSSVETVKGLNWNPEFYRQILNTGVTNLNSMFKGCSSLKTLDLRCIKTENVTDMTSMFEGCSDLEAIFVNDNWNVSNVTSSKDMFEGCDNLKGDYGTSFKDNPSVTDKTYARLDTKEEKGFLGKGDYSINIDWHVKDQKNNKTDDVDLNYRYTVYQHAHTNPVLEFANYPSTIEGTLYEAKYELDHWEYTISREPAILHTSTNNPTIIDNYNPIGDFDVNAYLNLRYYTVTINDGEQILASTSYPYGAKVDKPNLSSSIDHELSWIASYGDNTDQQWDFENNTIEGITDISAVWTPIEHTVTFHNGDEKSSITVLNGHSIDQPKVEQKAGHTLRWTIAKDVTSEEWDFERVVENDLELWAQWEAIPCTVTFYNGRNIIGSTTVPYGEIVSKPDFEASKGYNLKWQVWQQQKYTDWDFNTPIEVTNLEIYAITDKIEYTIKYHPEDARGNNPDKYTVETDDFTLYNPTTLGDSEFTGWTGTDIKTPTLEVTIPKGSIGNREYTANWKQSFYTVTFHDGTNETSISVAHGSTIKLPNLDKPGRTLLKWTVLPDPESEEWNENDAVTFALNLYAQWKDLETKQQITPSLSDADKYISFPKDWKLFCKKQETEAILTYSLAEGSGFPTNCNIIIETIEGSQPYSVNDGEVHIFQLPQFPGEYTCSAVFVGDEESTTPSDTIKFTLEITAARGLILQLYKNVIFVNNISEMFNTYQWYRYGEETDEKLKNGSRQYFTEPTLKGSYWALLNDKIHACYMEDEPVIVKHAEVSISTYPNPAVEGEEFTIEINNFDPDTEYSMIISNSNGNIIKQLTVTKQQTTLSLPRGFYTGALMSSGNKQSFKLIVR